MATDMLNQHGYGYAEPKIALSVFLFYHAMIIIDGNADGMMMMR